ncbi:ABC transporter permease [Desertibaculum subflavum]|uniref:ABC transporter permease n=1 Tax=Desertibaculum subflavum TaxID=2268458 RepID=UPI0034D32551
MSVADISYVLAIGGLATVALTILVGPVVIVLLTSFGDSQSLKFPPPGLTTKWYEALFDASQSRQIHRAAGNTLWVAGCATAGAILFGTLAALGLARSRSRLARIADTAFMSPLVLPGLAFGLAALMYFTFLGLRPSLELIMLGHAVVIVPFVLRTASASLSQLDPALLESSASLGASWLYTLRRVTLPIIAPGIVAGGFLAFIASMDNVPVSLFLAGPRSDMLPIRLWGMMESTLDVRVAAVSGIMVASVLGLMLIMERLVGLTRRMRD